MKNSKLRYPQKFCFTYIVYLLISTFPISSFANCTCESPTPSQAFEQADIIFSGKVIGLETNWISGGWKFSFEVEKSWKKQSNNFYIVNTGWEKDCGYIFEEGKSYLVYVKRKFTPKTDQCMGNLELADAKVIVQDLGEGLSPAMSDQVGMLSLLITLLAVLGLAFLAFVVLRKKNH